MTQQPGTLSAREVITSRGIRPLLLSSVVLTIGVMLQAAALGKHVYDITDSELSIGWLGLAEFLPAAALVLVTGTVADRLNRKKVSLFAQSGELLCSLLLMWYALGDPTSATPIYVIAVLFGASRAFLAPALRPIAAMIAPEGGLPRVIAFYSATWTGAAIIGPAVSGFLYAVDPALAYGVSALLIGGGMFSLSLVTLPPVVESEAKSERPTLRDAVEGLVFIRRTPVLLAAISLDLFAVLFGGAVALLPVIAEEQLKVGDVAYGWLRAAGGIGAAIMAVFLAFRPVRRHVGRTLLWVVAIFGAATIVLGTTKVYWIAFIAVLIAFAADMVSVFIRSSLVPLVTPDDKRGRVSAVENVFIGASNELGAFESGAVSSVAGTPATVIGGGIATIAIAGLWWVAFPSLRNVDRFEDLEDRAE
ncbi:MAG: MFS transporter [Actinobacteria bacterium]|jgi:MFS family permease|nr:MFS transporter [Actinomycetota bacterium]